MQHELPSAFIRSSLSALPPEERAAFLASYALPPVRGLRLRPGVLLCAVQAALPGTYAPIPWTDNAYYIDLDLPAGTHPLHAAGAYYLQEPSAMAAVAALDVRPGQRVLDLCAAPGGKSTQIGALLAGEGTLVSNEIVPQRAKVLSQNVERMGVRNAIVTNASPDRLAARWGEWFDRILVDAPCSGEGMFRREAASRAEWSAQSPGGCAGRQTSILDAAAGMLRPGGLLVYSTCTFNTTENDDVVSTFLHKHTDFLLEPFTIAGVEAAMEGMLRLWPHRVAGEGHFVARLRKRGADDGAKHPAAMTDLSDVWEGFAPVALPGQIFCAGENRWLLPADHPSLDGIRVLRFGLALGERRGKVFLPDHAAAMAFAPGLLAPFISVHEDAARRYLRGEVLEAPGVAGGWHTVAYEGLSLGWVKVSDGAAKNKLPKGLRQR